MTAIVGVNVKTEIQSTLGTAKTASAITQANPAVVTSTAHGFANGDVVVASIPGGMVELDGTAARIANVTTNTFELEGVDATAFSAFTAGTFQKVTAWQTFAAATALSMPNPAPNRLDSTRLIDARKSYVYALADAPDGSITAQFNPAGTAEALIKTATRNNTTLAFRITFAAGQKRIFNANVSGGDGFDMGQNAIATSTVAFTPVGLINDYTV